MQSQRGCVSGRMHWVSRPGVSDWQHGLVSEPMHANEVDTSQAVVGALLGDQCPQWAELSMTRARTSGTSNAKWRLYRTTGRDLAVRLPRMPRAAGGVRRELRVLPRLASTPLVASVAVPGLRHAGRPSAGFPYDWAVLEWMAGTDAWSGRHQLEPSTDVRLRPDLSPVRGPSGSCRPGPVSCPGGSEPRGRNAAPPRRRSGWTAAPHRRRSR